MTSFIGGKKEIRNSRYELDVTSVVSFPRKVLVAAFLLISAVSFVILLTGDLLEVVVVWYLIGAPMLLFVIWELFAQLWLLRRNLAILMLIASIALTIGTYRPLSSFSIVQPAEVEIFVTASWISVILVLECTAIIIFRSSVPRSALYISALILSISLILSLDDTRWAFVVGLPPTLALLWQAGLGDGAHTGFTTSVKRPMARWVLLSILVSTIMPFFILLMYVLLGRAGFT